jgi:hypothetical protein
MTEVKDTVKVFKCNLCTNNRPHKLLDSYLYDEQILWLVVCENCENARIINEIDHLEREDAKVVRCKCGKWKLKGQKCLECIILNHRNGF